jgi:signal transduction histidine kinase
MDALDSTPELTEEPSRILIVDDNPLIHQDFLKILNPFTALPEDSLLEASLFGAIQEKPKKTFLIDSAYQGEEVVAKIQQAIKNRRRYAMAFVDVRMAPGWDGVATTQRIWELDPDIQVVICTAYSDYSWNDMFKTFGSNDKLLILKKPFDVIEVLQLTHALTEKWRLAQLARQQVETLEAMLQERTQNLEAIRASERFARGQAHALTRIIDEITRESHFDRIVEHVLRALIQQLDASSSSIWLRNENTGALELILKSIPQIPAQSLPADPHYLWQTVRTGKSRIFTGGPDTLLVLPMLVAGSPAGMIGIRFEQKREFRAEELELAQALTNQAMLAIQLTRLSEKNRVSAIVSERNRMAREVHDTLAQGFTGVIVQLEAAGEAIEQSLPNKVSGHLERAGALARESLQEARRSVRALRPQALEENVLSIALHDLIIKMTADTNITAKFTIEGEARRLPPEWESNLLRIGQEVLTNVLRHSQATEFFGRLSFSNEAVGLNLRDNGIGFDLNGQYEGFGMVGMRERVESMEGELVIQTEKGRGTSICIVLPLDCRRTKP